jgi:hypothetical protein
MNLISSGCLGLSLANTIFIHFNKTMWQKIKKLFKPKDIQTYQAYWVECKLSMPLQDGSRVESGVIKLRVVASDKADAKKRCIKYILKHVEAPTISIKPV